MHEFINMLQEILVIIVRQSLFYNAVSSLNVHLDQPINRIFDQQAHPFAVRIKLYKLEHLVRILNALHTNFEVLVTLT